MPATASANDLDRPIQYRHVLFGFEQLQQGLALIVQGDRCVASNGPQRGDRPFEEAQGVVQIWPVLVPVISFSESRREVAGVRGPVDVPIGSGLKRSPEPDDRIVKITWMIFHAAAVKTGRSAQRPADSNLPGLKARDSHVRDDIVGKVDRAVQKACVSRSAVVDQERRKLRDAVAGLIRHQSVTPPTASARQIPASSMFANVTDPRSFTSPAFHHPAAPFIALVSCSVVTPGEYRLTR